MRGRATSREYLWRALVISLSVTFVVVVVWIDITSGVWQEAVILSGIAAGLLTFPLTAMFLQRWMDRVEHQKWQPVTRLALLDLLHLIADDEKSDIKRRKIFPRSIPKPTSFTHEDLHNLLHRVVIERDELTRALAQWSSFLAGSADVRGLMNNIADLAEELDDIRDATVTAEEDPTSTNFQETLTVEIEEYNQAAVRMIQEIERLIDDMD